MPDLPAFAALVASVKNAIDIAKAINGSSHTLEQAEIRLRIAELVSPLADAKLQTAEIKDLLQEKDERIAELEEALAIKVQLIRHHDAYYEIDADGGPSGDPFCLRCWEVNHKQFHIVRMDGVGGAVWKCPACETLYNRRGIYISTPAKDAETEIGQGKFA